MCVCVCVCVCVFVLRMCNCIEAFMCVCVCVCVEATRVHTSGRVNVLSAKKEIRNKKNEINVPKITCGSHRRNSANTELSRA